MLRVEKMLLMLHLGTLLNDVISLASYSDIRNLNTFGVPLQIGHIQLESIWSFRTAGADFGAFGPKLGITTRYKLTSERR